MSDMLRTIGDYVQETMASWQVPGVALAVIQGNAVLHMAGYGVRNIATQQPVTPDTRFALASMTTAFTAMGVALLVDEGRLEWDRPVRDYLPTFKLRDSYASEKITLRDMLCHRSGLPRHDLAWYGAPLSREDIVKALAYLEANHSFREVWQYQNMMYVAAGYIMGLMAGTSWEAFIQARIFDPLGMTHTTFSASDMQKADDYSLPYRVQRSKQPGEADRLERLPFYDNVAMGPAASLHSSLSDLVKWLTVQLNGGRSGNFRLVSAANLAQMHQPQMVIPVDGIKARLMGNTIATYGMGWFVEPYRGYTLVQHGGNIDGFSLLTSFIPQAKIGVIVLTNADSKPLRDLLTFEVYDRLLGLPDHDWNARYQTIYREIYKGQDQDKQTSESERSMQAPHTHPLVEYAGEYAANGYYDVKVRYVDGALQVCFAGEWLPLNHYHYDVFEAYLARFEERLKVIFGLDTRGVINSLTVPIEPAVKDVLFKRRPPILSEESLVRLAGIYKMPFEGLMLTFTLKPDGKLVGVLTGQTEFELVPYLSATHSTEFKLKGKDNIALEFRHDDKGAPSEVILKQEGAVFHAPRMGTGAM